MHIPCNRCLFRAKMCTMTMCCCHIFLSLHTPKNGNTITPQNMQGLFTETAIEICEHKNVYTKTTHTRTHSASHICKTRALLLISPAYFTPCCTQFYCPVYGKVRRTDKNYTSIVASTFCRPINYVIYSKTYPSKVTLHVVPKYIRLTFTQPSAAGINHSGLILNHTKNMMVVIGAQRPDCNNKNGILWLHTVTNVCTWWLFTRIHSPKHTLVMG
jgi:hypothetical protein